MSNGPAFVKYVSSVEGRVVPRFGTDTKGQAAEFIGARRVFVTKEQRRAGEATIVWEPKRVIPLTEAYYLRFKREVDRAIRGGDLLERTAEEYASFRKLEERQALELAEKARRAEAEERAKVEAAEKATAKESTGAKPGTKAGGKTNEG